MFLKNKILFVVGLLIILVSLSIKSYAFELHLKEGLNFVVFPAEVINKGLTAFDFLDIIMDEEEEISRPSIGYYDGEYIEAYWDEDFGQLQPEDGDFELKCNVAYIIFIWNIDSFEYVFDTDNQKIGNNCVSNKINLKAGINTVNFYGLNAGDMYTAERLFNDLGEDKIKKIIKYIDDTEKTQEVNWDNIDTIGKEFLIVPDKGYYLYMRQDVVDFMY